METQDGSGGERAAGLLLIAAAALALALANSPLQPAFDALLHVKLGPLSLQHWIMDGLMALFFLLVGLEVKREWYDGQLASSAARRLPIIAAGAGMAVPALVYIAASGFAPLLMRGWAIPAATDIAFALGVLALIGPGAPPALKLLLVTIAIVDDIGAVAIIALFYTDDLNLMALAGAGAVFAGMYAMNRLGVCRLWPYLIGFAVLWLAVYQSGVHATIAGVLAALTIPLGLGQDHSPLKRLEHAIHPWVMFGIMPVFGLVSAGVSIGSVAMLLAPLPLAVALGLFLGKQLGVFGAVWLADRMGIAPKPTQLGWGDIYAAALLCGIGFTMSLFIGTLAFPDPVLAAEAKIGTLAGSVLSVLAATVVLKLIGTGPESADDRSEAEELFGANFDEEPCLDPPPCKPGS